MQPVFRFFSVCLLAILPAFPALLTAQVAINPDGTQPHPSAMLEVKSNNKGILIPRMTAQQRAAIPSPANGLIVYDTDSSAMAVFVSTAWAFLKPFSGPTPTKTYQIIDADGDTWVDTYTGLTDGDIVVFNLGGPGSGGTGTVEMILRKNASGQARLEFPDSQNNTFIGDKTGEKTTTGTQNTAVGNMALMNNTTGLNNTATGRDALRSNTEGGSNTACGSGALFANLGGDFNTAIGASALFLNTEGIANTAVGLSTLLHNTTGSENTAVGQYALQSNTTGMLNTAVGAEALHANITGANNVAIGRWALHASEGKNNLVAIGAEALFSNKNGDFNTAIGHNALHDNIDGPGNTAVGFEALYKNINAGGNTANGWRALYANETGIDNTAMGRLALTANKAGLSNVAIGTEALASNLAGHENTVVGAKALSKDDFGNGNTAIGFEALLNASGQAYANVALGHKAMHDNLNGSYNTAVGTSALSNNTTGSSITALGYNANVSIATPSLTNAAAIGQNATVNASDKMQLGSSTTILATSGAYTIVSDGRFKEAVQDDIQGLDFILQLRPVTYRFNYEKYEDALRGQLREDDQHYKAQLAKRSQERQMGFIAQEVEVAVNQAGKSFNGLYLPKHPDDNYALDYGRFTVPLVKAIQEQQTQIEQLKAENVQLRQQLEQLQTLEARLQALENQHR